MSKQDPKSGLAVPSGVPSFGQNVDGDRTAEERSSSDLQAQEAQNWIELSQVLKQETGVHDFTAWLKPLFLFQATPDRITLAAPSRFVRDWVQANYLPLLTEGWQTLNPKILLVEIIVRAPRTKAPQPIDGSDAGPDHQARGHQLSLQSPASFPNQSSTNELQANGDADFESLSSPLDPTCTIENFVVDGPNELAVAAVKRVIDSKVPCFNPLVIYGGVGLGKTHLLQALAWGLRERYQDRKVAYISAEKFLYSFVSAIRSKRTEVFKSQIRTLDVLLIDDMQYITSGEATQEEFVQTFNTLFDRNRQVVVATNRPPSQLEQLDERLRSRLMGGLSVDLQPTTQALRLSVLRDKAKAASGLISEEVLTYVAEKIPANIREIEGALNRLIAHANLLNRPVSVELARSVLSDLIAAREKRVSIEEIQRRVCQHFEIKQSDMVSSRRARQVARPRQIAMYLSKHLTSRSLPEIGRRFGNRDHTTVMHAIKRVDELMCTDAGFAAELDDLKRILDS